jgi:hypothetical protein
LDVFLDLQRKDDLSKKEVDPRPILIKNMLSRPKLNYDACAKEHQYWADKDPLFYTHLAAWYSKNGSVRDHQEIFCAVMLASHIPTMQDAGFVLLQNLRTYQVARIIRLSKKTLGRVSRPLKRAVTFWVRRREDDAAWLEECMLRDRDSMKTLYASLHIKPNQMAQKILFENAFEVSSRFGALQKLSKSTNPQEVAAIIRNAQIPFTTAIGAIKSPSKDVWSALIDSMTGQQVINHLKAFQRKGLTSNPDLAKQINDKMQSAKEMSRSSQVKKLVAAKAMDAKGHNLDALMESMRAELLKNGPINEKTAIFIDKSGSMELAIELGKMIATACTFALEDAPVVLTFNSTSHKININKSDGAGEISKKFELIRAAGGTNIGAPFQYLVSQKIPVDQIILISDGEHNAGEHPIYPATQYIKDVNPNVHLVYIEIQPNGVSKGANLQHSLVNVFSEKMTHLPFSGDYYGIQTIINALSSKGRNGILDEVMASNIPDLSNLENLGSGFNEDNNEIK